MEMEIEKENLNEQKDTPSTPKINPALSTPHPPKKEKTSAINEAALEIILPILRLRKKINMKMEYFEKNYNELNLKAETALKEIQEAKETIPDYKDAFNISEFRLLPKIGNKHEETIEFYKDVSESLDLFTQLLNSEEYNKLLEKFNSTIKEDNLTNEVELKEIEDIEEQKIKIRSRKSAAIKKKISTKIKKNEGK